MKVWMVFVNGGNISFSFRYIDSQWASVEGAQRRVSELTDTFKAFGIGGTPGLSASIREGFIADAKLVELPTPDAREPSGAEPRFLGLPETE